MQKRINLQKLRLLRERYKRIKDTNTFFFKCKAIGSEFTNENEKRKHFSKIDSISDCCESGSQFSRQNTGDFPNMVKAWKGSTLELKTDSRIKALIMKSLY